MIADNNVAEKVSKMVLECSAKLDESVEWVQKDCAPEELKVYRQAIGKILTDILFEIMNPLYKAHPELKPPKLYVP